jgi:DNA-binding MarR family transcriptional regulator
VVEEKRPRKTQGQTAGQITGRTTSQKAVKTPAKTQATGGIKMGVLPELMGYMLRQCQLLVYQDFHHAVGDEHIRPPQFSLLEIVNANPGIRPSDVSTSLGISRANLVPLLSELEGRGWMVRKGDKHDGRAQALHLTRAGVAQLARLHELVIPHEQRLAARLGPVGRDILLKLLHALVTETADKA